MRYEISLILLLPLIFAGYAASSKAVKSNSTSLYTGSSVVELSSSNMSVAENDTERLWVVEFYAHVCPHCQHFAPVWKGVADELNKGGTVLGTVK